MLLGLSQIIDCPGASVSFSTSLDFRDLRFGSSYPVQEPVLATGTVRNTAGVLILEGKLTTRLHGVCDRCAREFQRDVEFPISAVLVTSWPMKRTRMSGVFQLEGRQRGPDGHCDHGVCPEYGFQAPVQTGLQRPVLPGVREPE